MRKEIDMFLELREEAMSDTTLKQINLSMM